MMFETLFLVLFVIVIFILMGILTIVWLLFKLFKRTRWSKYPSRLHEDMNNATDTLEKIYDFLNETVEKTQHDEEMVARFHRLTPKSTNSRNLPLGQIRDESITTDDPLLTKLIDAYESVAIEEKFVPISMVVQSLLQHKLVETSNEANMLIKTLILRYPRVIRVEDVRGGQEQHIAIYKEMM